MVPHVRYPNTTREVPVLSLICAAFLLIATILVVTRSVSPFYADRNGTAPRRRQRILVVVLAVATLLVGIYSSTVMVDRGTIQVARTSALGLQSRSVELPGLHPVVPGISYDTITTHQSGNIGCLPVSTPLGEACASIVYAYDIAPGKAASLFETYSSIDGVTGQFVTPKLIDALNGSLMDYNPLNMDPYGTSRAPIYPVVGARATSLFMKSAQPFLTSGSVIVTGIHFNAGVTKLIADRQKSIAGELAARDYQVANEESVNQANDLARQCLQLFTKMVDKGVSPAGVRCGAINAG